MAYDLSKQLKPFVTSIQYSFSMGLITDTLLVLFFPTSNLWEKSPNVQNQMLEFLSLKAEAVYCVPVSDTRSSQVI